MPTLNCHNPWGGPHHRPHRPQCEYLSVDRRSVKGISSTHFVGGRGSAKTTTGILLLHRTAFSDMPGVPGFWSEPRYADLEKVFLREWERIVPAEFWDYNVAKRQLRLSSGTVVDLVSRNVDNPSKKVGIGPNYGFGFVDEAAEKFTVERWNDLKNSIRLQSAPYRFLDSLSTPVVNGYYRLCTKDGARVIHSTSYDNPFISSDAIDDMVADMSPNYVAQEIRGEWIRMEGRVWQSFSEQDFPAGNMHWARWNPDQPWYLGMDLGQGLGHWQIWQYHDAVDRDGRPVFKGRVAVVVAEGLQHNQSIHPVLELISDKYAQAAGRTRPPVVVAIGHDVNTRGATGPAPSLALHQRSWPYWYPRNEQADKALQGQVLDRLLLNTLGERRFCVSRNIQRHGPERDAWGILHTMLTDTYPEPGGREWYRKDKREAGISNVEDARDSALYLAMHNHPPQWAPHDRQAA